MLGADLYPLRLQHLADVEERRKILRFRIIPQQVFINQGIADRAFLVDEHHRRENSRAIPGLGEGLHGPHFREGLKSVLRDKTEVILFVSRKRRLAVPDAPIVNVSGLIGGRCRLEVGAGRTRPIRGFGGESRHGLTENAAGDRQVVLPHLEKRDRVGRNPVRPAERRLGLVVAAPENDRRVVAQAPDLVLGLLRHAQLERVGARLHFVAEHEVLPDHQAELVAQAVEFVRLVVAAAPVADDIHVRRLGGFENPTIVRRGHAIRETVEGNHVGSLCEDRNAVDHEFE